MLETIGIIDLIFISILAISTLIGLIRGVIREVLSLVGLAASIYLAFTFADKLSKQYTSKFLEEPQISYIVTFVLIIVATLFCVTLINLFFSQLLKASGLSFVNRFFGAMFGLIRGAVFCSILVMVMGFVPGMSSKTWWQASTLAPIFKNLTKATFKYLPKEINDYFDSAKNSVGRAANELGVPVNTNADEQTLQHGVILESIDNVNNAIQENAEPVDTAPQRPKVILESYQEESSQ